MLKNKTSQIFHFLLKGPEKLGEMNVLKRRYLLVKFGLFAICLLSSLLTLILILGKISEGEKYNGAPIIFSIALSFIFLTLWFVCKPSNSGKIGLFLISLLAIAGYYVSASWGIDAPLGLLIYSLSISICGMLFGAKSIIQLFLVHTSFLISVATLQANGILQYQSEWRYEVVSTTDGISIAVMLFVISFVSFIFNKQVELADHETKIYANKLLLERNLLEDEVLKRTQQLRTAQLDRIFTLYRLAELGKSSAGILHDLAQPVTAAFLSLHDINNISRSKTIKQQIEITNEALKNIEQYITVARRQVNQKSSFEKLLVQKIIDQQKLLFRHQFRKNQIKFISTCHPRLTYKTDPSVLTPILTNLIGNAIDACLEKPIGKRVISISVKRKQKILIIEVADSGTGIDKQHINHIFEPFFSTKSPDRGMGIGLAQVKSIVTETLGGEILVNSKKPLGTTFLIKLPN